MKVTYKTLAVQVLDTVKSNWNSKTGKTRRQNSPDNNMVLRKESTKTQYKEGNEEEIVPTSKGLEKNKNEGQASASGNLPQWCCITSLVVNDQQKNVFVNVTNLKGQTIVKFAARVVASLRRPLTQQPKRLIARSVIQRVGSAIGGHYDYTKVVVQARSIETILYLKESLRKWKRPKIIYYKGQIPIAHNGCRPPKKRRI